MSNGKNPGDIATALKVVTAITISPRDIIDFIQVGAPKGQIQIWSFSIAIAAPVGLTTTWNYRLPYGWVSAARTPYRFTSDRYDPNLTVTVMIGDGEVMQPITNAMAITSPQEVRLDFVPKKYGMDVIIINNSPGNAVITMSGTIIWLEKSYFERFYEKLIKLIYHAAEELL